ncbi:hypothetical protein A2368_01790 [Candidatus Collierbacteria bacterium RIFOXYB1_FULL_49_13]|uniref:YbaB/EbfC family DNA-binding protein n=1 Tax=Candidatus Collierbacteria bacterium RIFOXYB1_FULL_49_13 TaxID=1817728 RepID=A0A1F5FIH0_9BACT|nr:MAG: hypothetical protein A2368_01790 [Candidatus Collierbacteria bacterium RIFOXYB1_FULL_49_13]
MFDKFSNVGSKGAAGVKLAMLQQKIKSKKIVHKVGDIEVVVTGEGKIKRIEISREENRELAKAINAAITEAQKWAAAEMQGMMGDLQKFLGK